MLSRSEARKMLEWAHAQNPGPWREHVLHAARAAEAIAQRAGMDPDRAYVSGLLHDVGRFEGVRAMHHIVAGYKLLTERGEPELARICMTHSFPGGNPYSYLGAWDVSEEEKAFIISYITGCEFDDYDRLIQLCDALAMSEGICLIEKRLVNVAIRHGVNEHVSAKWRATLELQLYFENRMGCGLYSLFDDVAANTFSRDFVQIPPN